MSSGLGTMIGCAISSEQSSSCLHHICLQE